MVTSGRKRTRLSHRSTDIEEPLCQSITEPRMKPLEHHLYQIIKRACEVYGKCTFAKKTFCRVQARQRKDNSEGDDCSRRSGSRKRSAEKGSVITLCLDHQEVYTAIRNKAWFHALDQAHEEEKREIVHHTFMSASAEPSQSSCQAGIEASSHRCACTSPKCSALRVICLATAL